MSFFGELGKDLEGLASDAPLGAIRAELEALATQVGEISKELDSARGSVQWTGAAADAFHTHAARRIKDLHDLVRELDGAAAAAGAVVVAGGLL
ncbi:hypothetical protein GCM10009760_08030 [Kitasatospora kazusensis]|uniref:WXG100 family type VII secretion target n=1 Tax=Kitasatospora kazusensis TaxID=407974 RepID=A0ABP5KIV3_9ACTN